MIPCAPGTCEHPGCEDFWLAAIGLRRRTADPEEVERLADDWKRQTWRYTG